jgi:hypothetical protein
MWHAWFQSLFSITYKGGSLWKSATQNQIGHQLDTKSKKEGGTAAGALLRSGRGPEDGPDVLVSKFLFDN